MKGKGRESFFFHVLADVNIWRRKRYNFILDHLATAAVGIVDATVIRIRCSFMRLFRCGCLLRC